MTVERDGFEIVCDELGEVIVVGDRGIAAVGGVAAQHSSVFAADLGEDITLIELGGEVFNSDRAALA